MSANCKVTKIQFTLGWKSKQICNVNLEWFKQWGLTLNNETANKNFRLWLAFSLGNIGLVKT